MQTKVTSVRNKTIRFTLHKINICCFFAALIFSMSGIRYIFDIQESNMMIYGIYGIFVLCSMLTNISHLKRIKHMGIIPLLVFFLMIYALLTPVLTGGTSNAITGIKIVLVFLVSFSFFLMKLEDIRKTINWSYILILLFISVLLIHPQGINRYLSKGSNYLVLTLPIGWLLSMMLARTILKLYCKKRKEIIPDVLISVFTFMALTKFTGRGSIIFPFLVAVIFAVVLGRKHFFQRIIVIISIGIIIIVGYLLFLRYANQYIVNRMMRLITDRSSEDRWEIWRQYINYILEDFHWIMGTGTGGSIRDLGFYPHNLYLQTIGEYGIIGLFFSGYITVYLVKAQVQTLTCPLDFKEKLLFVELSSGLMYLFFNFMKSFPIYDSITLIMMIFGLLSVYYQLGIGKRYDQCRLIIDYVKPE